MQIKQSNLNEFLLTQTEIKQKDDRPLLCLTHQTNTTEIRNPSIVIPRPPSSFQILSCPLFLMVDYKTKSLLLQQGHTIILLSLSPTSSSLSPPSRIYPVAITLAVTGNSIEDSSCIFSTHRTNARNTICIAQPEPSSRRCRILLRSLPRLVWIVLLLECYRTISLNTWTTCAHYTAITYTQLPH